MSAQNLAKLINDRTGGKPVDMGLILGSGLSGLVDVVQDAVAIPYADLPGFPHAGVSGHNPNLVIGTIEGVKETTFIVTRTLSYLAGVITGRESAEQLGGPIRVVNMSSQVAAISFLALLNLTAVLSASIGLINLFPIPMLDGGHLAFYAVEFIRGKPLSEKAQEYGFKAGLAVILALFLFVNWNDINFLMGS